MEAFILSAVRTPIGKFLGDLADIPATQLGIIASQEALRRGGVSVDSIDEVIFGQVLQAGCGQNPARQVALGAQFPQTIPAYTVNKVCGSGLKAVMLAAQAIRAEDAECVLAGGMESMSRAPHLVEGSRVGFKYGDGKMTDSLIRDGLWCPYENWPMGEAAEYIATRCGISRIQQDHFAAQSHHRAAMAWERGEFKEEIVPISVGKGSKARTVQRDGGVRPQSTVQELATLRTVFRPDGTVTAGNASQLSDGAAALVVASSQFVKKSGQKPLAKIVAYGTSGVAPREIFRAPVLAVHQVLAKANLTLQDIDLFELNEAFAAQMLACGQELGLDMDRVNVHGGAIALGHPIGASGARLLVTLLHALKNQGKKRGLASLCLGGGNAVAMIVELVDESHSA